jgi:hypothetical protein
MKLSTLTILTLLIILPIQTWAGLLAAIKTEPVILDGDSYKLINLALDEHEEGLSNKIDLDSVKAERAIGDNKPAFFKQGYKSYPVDDTYTRYAEVHCKQTLKADNSWECKNSGQALLFSTGESEQTIWLEYIEVPIARKVIEFLREMPTYQCDSYRHSKNKEKENELCLFDKENLKTIKAIRLSTSYDGHGNKDTRLEAGNYRHHPSAIYRIEPAQCDEDQCPFEITSKSLIMY